MTKQLTEATKIGYRTIGTGIKSYLYGIWLQLSRLAIFFLWFFIAGVIAALFAPVHETLVIVGFVGSFFTLPILYGYYELRGENDG